MRSFVFNIDAKERNKPIKKIIESALQYSPDSKFFVITYDHCFMICFTYRPKIVTHTIYNEKGEPLNNV